MGYLGSARLRMRGRSQIVGEHAKEKGGDQHCGSEREHTNGIHGLFPRNRINLRRAFNLVSAQAAGISAEKHGISAETLSCRQMERGRGRSPISQSREVIRRRN
jgi:hypothetical protein